MADPTFPRKRSKRYSLSINLGWRVFLLCIGFVALPLIIYGGLMIHHINEIQKEEAFMERQMSSETQTTLEKNTEISFKNPMKHPLWRLFSWAVLLIAGVGGATVIWLTYRMTKPYKHLMETMDQVEEGLYDVRYEPMPFGFEVNTLGDRFNHMLKTMVENMMSAQELEIGREIQKSLFPKASPLLLGLDIATVFHPAKQVSGDFYDLFRSNDRLLIVIADAAGKGVSACIYSLLLRGMLRGLTEKGHSLEEIVTTAHKLLKMDSGPGSMFITAWVGILDLKTVQLQYTSLGHYPGLLCRQNNVEELGTDGSALGVETAKPLKIATVELKKGDFLVLFTDGLVEMPGNNRAKLAEQMQSLSLESSAAQMLTKLEPPPPFEDDLTLIALKIV